MRSWGRENSLQVLVLLVGLLVPALLSLRTVIQPKDSDELRFPPPGEGLQQRFLSLRQQLAEQMGMRRRLTRALGEATYRLFGVSATREIVAGERGWLFESLETEDVLRPVSGNLGGYLADNRRALAAQGIDYLVVFVPCKATVYARRLPSWARTEAALALRQQRRREALQQTRAQGVRVLDLTEPLVAESTQRRVYHKTDYHWNPWGAFVAAQLITRELQRLFPEMPTLQGRPMETKVTWGRTSAARAGLDGCLPEGVNQPQPWAHSQSREAKLDWKERSPGIGRREGDPRGPRVLLFHDSYGASLVEPLSEVCSSLYHVRAAPLDSLVQRTKPDVVVHQIAELSLTQLTYLSLDSPGSTTPASHLRWTGPHWINSRGRGLAVAGATSRILMPYWVAPLGSLLEVRLQGEFPEEDLALQNLASSARQYQPDTEREVKARLDDDSQRFGLPQGSGPWALGSAKSHRRVDSVTAWPVP